MAYVVSALWRAKPGEEERIARLIERMVGPSRAEPACRFYQPHRSPENPRLFYLYEQYEDEDGYQAHMDSEHFQRLVVGEVIPNLESRERTFFETMVDDRGGLAESHEDDVREIRRVHRQWWAANQGLDVEKMRECFAPGYLMWNLNSHPYFSLAEKEHLFRYYKDHMVPIEPPELWDISVTVDGDMGYVTSEGILPVVIASSEGSGSAVMDAAAPHYERRDDTVRFRFRETAVFRRDDGQGNPVWKIWHFHCSPLAPEDEPRPGFGDTAAERGRRGPVEMMSDTS